MELVDWMRPTYPVGNARNITARPSRVQLPVLQKLPTTSCSWSSACVSIRSLEDPVRLLGASTEVPGSSEQCSDMNLSRTKGTEQPVVLQTEGLGFPLTPWWTCFPRKALYLWFLDLCFPWKKMHQLLGQLILLKLAKTNSQNSLTHCYPEFHIFKTSFPGCSTYFYIYYFREKNLFINLIKYIWRFL